MKRNLFIVALVIFFGQCLRAQQAFNRVDISVSVMVK